MAGDRPLRGRAGYPFLLLSGEDAMTVLTTRSLTLRPWRASDVSALVVHANDRRISQNLRDRFPHPYGRTDAESWVEFASSLPPPHRHLAICVEDEAIGSIGIDAFEDVHRRTGELGYWIGAACWGRGYATEAVVAMTTYGFETLEFARIQAAVFEWNPASTRVLSKAGYRFEGTLRSHVVKDGRLGDALLYAAIRAEHLHRDPDR
ncbi:GNAT family N-acetyltransferase [Myxococcus sp. K15C18031901]|uniref:GNAT family N-acetyltransferase n=1 Tax=Myxococcus dinghuensis TaxID=2906761 RepID=UPI0020A6F8FF|nr:GNAT family protein [Myxococcus dinghuensis]MCP3100455.1 GNAT family N-acetyltransferase [Myxococcus dinghuensis]